MKKTVWSCRMSALPKQDQAPRLRTQTGLRQAGGISQSEILCCRIVSTLVPKPLALCRRGSDD